MPDVLFNVVVMKKLALIISLFVLSFGVSSLYAQSPKPENKPKKPKNIILMIGDGMGTAQIYAAIVMAQDQLNFNRFKFVGFSKTYSADDFITDSAAGGTALSTGKKTKNSYIGVDPEGKKQETILEMAEKNGLSTGMVTTCDITHATPASFIAHVSSRKQMDDIALDFLKTDIDVFIGGGLNRFNKREDKLNLVDSLKKRNYQMVYKLDSLQFIRKGKLAGLLYPNHPPKISEGRGDMLRTGVRKAVELLSQNKKGFFMMVEGSQIDWGGHDTNSTYVVNEVIDFDKAIGAALDFAERDGNTLVIVTADHETGGLSLVGGDIRSYKIKASFAWSDHTGVMVPVFAYGPGAEEFTGIMQNTDIFLKIKKAFGF